MASIILVNSLLSYKFIRITRSYLCALDTFHSKFTHINNFNRILQYFYIISLALINIPIILTMIYNLFYFSTGNALFLQSLDCLSIFIISFLITMIDTVHLNTHYTLTPRNNKKHTVSLGPNDDHLNLEDFSVFPN